MRVRREYEVMVESIKRSATIVDSEHDKKRCVGISSVERCGGSLSIILYFLYCFLHPH